MEKIKPIIYGTIVGFITWIIGELAIRALFAGCPPEASNILQVVLLTVSAIFAAGTAETVRNYQEENDD